MDYKDLLLLKQELLSKQEQNLELILEHERLKAEVKPLFTTETPPKEEPEVENERTKSQRIRHKQLAEILKGVFVDTPQINKEHLAIILRDQHGWTWKNLTDTVTSLRSKDLLNIKVTRKDGKTFYSLDI